MQIKNLMSENIITVDKDQNLTDALKLLRKHNVSRLPVTNNKELVGIISERDIANKLGSSKYENMPASRLHVSSVMIKDVITVPQSMQLGEVAKIMLEKGIGSVPVMEDNEMVGIVSKADFVTLAVGIAFDKISVKEIMCKNLISVSPSERIVHARRQMIESHIGRLPVVDDETLVGMVTSKDLMRAFIEFRKSVPEKYQKSQIKDLLVEDIMSSNPVFVSKDMSITEISNIIMETGFNGLRLRVLSLMKRPVILEKI